MILPLAIAGVATLAAGGFHYAALWPESQVFGQTLVAGSDVCELAFTYDDGPNDPYTMQMLEVLARYQVHATFFMIGEYVRQQPDIARAVLQAGHVIGSHTRTHPRLMYATRRRIHEEIYGGHAMIEDAVGERVAYFRPPFGARRPEVLRVAREASLVPVMWNVSGRDWNATSARAIEMQVERGVVHNHNRRRASNVLLHDGSHTGMGADRRRTVSATATLLGMMPRTGMRLVTVDQWAQPPEPYLVPAESGLAEAGEGQGKSRA